MIALWMLNKGVPANIDTLSDTKLQRLRKKIQLIIEKINAIENVFE